MSKVKHKFNFVLHRGHGEKISDPDFLSQNDPLKNKSKGSRCSFIGKQKFIRFTGFISVFTLLILIVLSISPIVLKTNSAEGATEDGDSETVLTITSSKGSSNLVLEASSPTGTFASSPDDDMANFTVTTTNFTGYTLNLSGNESDLISSDVSESSSINSSIASISSISSAVSANDFASTDTDKTALYNNKWGYQVNLLDTTATSSAGKNVYNTLKDGNFLPAPAIADPDNKEVSLSTTSDANGSTKHPDTIDTYAIRLGARIDYTVPTGIYTNTFTIAAVANPVSYTISYNDTSGDSTVTGAPINPKVVTTGQTPTDIGDTTINATLYNDGVPTRTGYVFAGWCDGIVTHIASGNSTCNGTTYQKGAEYLINRTIDNSDIVLHAMWRVNQYTCTKRYSLQNANGSYGSYTTESTVSVNFGSTCSYSKTVTDYNSNNAKSTSCTMGINGCTLSLDFPRNTYTLTINRNTSYISSVSGAGTYRWGQSVNISATAASNSEFTGWSQTSGTTGSFGNTASSSTTFTMGKGAATIYANGKSTCVAISGYIQDFTGTGNYCSTSGTLTDKRDNNTYTVAKINGNWWMTQNLRYLGDSGSASTSMTIKSATTNINADKTMSYTDLTKGDTYTAARIHNSGSTTTGVWYNFCAGSAGTLCKETSTAAVSYDLCPKNWRLPTKAEFDGIISYISSFNLVGGGYYRGGTNRETGTGRWWSSTTTSDGGGRYRLNYISTTSIATGTGTRVNGHYVRCVKN